MGHDRIREDAIKIKNNRPASMKGFCYKNQDKRLRKFIFPAKWVWRINEKRNVLKEHEFLNQRPKRTAEMEELKKKYNSKKLQKNSTTL